MLLQSVLFPKIDRELVMLLQFWVLSRFHGRFEKDRPVPAQSNTAESASVGREAMTG